MDEDTANSFLHWNYSREHVPTILNTDITIVIIIIKIIIFIINWLMYLFF